MGATLEGEELGWKLCMEASKNNVEGIQVLWKNGMDINQSDHQGRTPLHLACSNGCAEAALAILRHPDVDVNPIDYKGNTPLDDAIACKDKMMQALLERQGGLIGNDPLILDKKIRIREPTTYSQIVTTNYSITSDCSRKQGEKTFYMVTRML
eukprot:TRINITY_DN48972_c0_g1_i2.p4 TRINITY_DN48972_c0_g1~~TRINITY_DN48972_c0_g1_i2.p4  ORF type:complete len:153 (+),score=11.75 TRINITY_DN48972_c0_g1_i2:293-751(+)